MTFSRINFAIVFLTVTMLFQVSCLKKQNLEDTGGPTANAKTVQEKMGEGAGDLNSVQIRVNETSSMTQVTTFADTQTIKVFTQSLAVDSYVVSGSTVTFNLLYSMQNFMDTNQSFSSVLYPLQFGIGNALAMKSIVKQQTSIPEPTFLFEDYRFIASGGCQRNNISCFNFKYTDSTITLPSELADTRICPDVAKCVIPVRQVELDFVNNNQIVSGKPDRKHLTFIVSSKLPYLSKVLQYCQRYLTVFGDKPVVREDCYNVNGFTIGDNFAN